MCSYAFTHNLRQDAVYWAPNATGAYGTKTFVSGVAVNVKWFERNDVYRKPTGEESVSNAIVHVGQDMSIGGYLYLGTLASLTPAQKANPLVVTNAKRIEGFEKTPQVSGGNYVRRVFL